MKVGVPEGSFLSPLQFIIVFQAITEVFKMGCPRELLYTTINWVLIAESIGELDKFHKLHMLHCIVVVCLPNPHSSSHTTLQTTQLPISIHLVGPPEHLIAIIYVLQLLLVVFYFSLSLFFSSR